MFKLKKGKILLFFVVLFFVFFIGKTTNFISAAEADEIAIYPAHWDLNEPLTQSWFIYNLNPGDYKIDEAQLVNLSDNPVTIDVYPVDALTTKEGAFALKNRDESKGDVGAWIKLLFSEITLEPRESRALPFSISIPKDVEVGDHAGGLVVEKRIAEEGPLDQQFRMKIVTRVGVRMYVRVLGEINENLSIEKFFTKLTNQGRWFVLELKNLGNVRLAPEGSIAIKDIFQRNVASLTIEKSGEVFPKKSVTREILLSKKLILGRFVALATLNYADKQIMSSPLVFWIIPWWVIVILVLLVLIIIYLILRKYLKKRTKERGQDIKWQSK